MTVNDVRHRLILIGNLARSLDYEGAHAEEDRLFIEVLEAVAAGKAGDNVALAALQSRELLFPRACA